MVLRIHILIPCNTIASPDFQVIDEINLEKIFLCNYPAQRTGEEVGKFVVLAKGIRPIPSQGSRYKVFLIEVIIYPAEIGKIPSLVLV